MILSTQNIRWLKKKKITRGIYQNYWMVLNKVTLAMDNRLSNKTNMKKGSIDVISHGICLSWKSKIMTTLQKVQVRLLGQTASIPL